MFATAFFSPEDIFTGVLLFLLFVSLTSGGKKA